MKEKQLTIDLLQLRNQIKTEISKRADDAMKTMRKPTDRDILVVIFKVCPWIVQLIDSATSEVLLDILLESFEGGKDSEA